MMPESESLREIHRLADAFFDGQLDAGGAARLEQLLEEDPVCLHAFADRIDLHGALMEYADPQTNLQAAVQVLNEFAHACERQSAIQKRRWIVSLSTIAAVLIAIFVPLFLFSTGESRHAPPRSEGPIIVAATIGTMAPQETPGKGSLPHSKASLLNDLPILVGQVIEIGDETRAMWLNNGVRCMVSGPASLTFSSRSEVELTFGTIVATVPPQAVGFTVKTPDFRVVDLGTTFGVSLAMEGAAEVHVFQGMVSATSTLLGDNASPQLLRAGEGLRIQRSIVDPGGLPSPVWDRTSSELVPDQLLETLNQLHGIESHAGHVRVLNDPPRSVAPQKLVSSRWLHVIPEKTSVILQQALSCVAPSGKLHSPEACQMTSIPAGTRCRSVLIHGQCNDSCDPWKGEIRFRQPILGLLISNDQLFESDPIFSLAGTEYPEQDDLIKKELSRGALIPFAGVQDLGDRIEISADRKTFRYELYTGNGNMDQIRVILQEDIAAF